MNMTRQHFELLADVVKGYTIPNGSGSVGVTKLAHDLADVLATTNGAFKREKFLEACGIPMEEW